MKNLKEKVLEYASWLCLGSREKENKGKDREENIEQIELEDQLEIPTEENRSEIEEVNFSPNNIRKKWGMSNAQKWLDKNYPKGKRGKVTKLKLNPVNDNLEGSLIIEGFDNLKEIEIDNCIITGQYSWTTGGSEWISRSKFTRLKLNNLPKLTKFKARDCYRLADISVINCPEISHFDTNSSRLTNLNFLNNLNSEKLTFLNVHGGNYFKVPLVVENFPNLEELDCSANDFTKIAINSCPKLCKFKTRSNSSTGLDFLNGLNPDKLVDLEIVCFSSPKQDLSIFSKFVNLERLELSCTRNYNKERAGIEEGIHGSLEPLKNLTKLKTINLSGKIFGSLEPLRNLTELENLIIKDTDVSGSLEPLRNLNKLEYLNIENTDLNKGLEYLPESLEKIHCFSRIHPSVDIFGKKENPGSRKLERELKKHFVHQNYGEHYDLQTWRKLINKNHISTQEYLDQNYPCEQRKQIKTLDIPERNLEGELDLSDFTNLETFWCRQNRVTNLNLTNCPHLKELICFKNQITQLDLSQNKELKELDVTNNQLTRLNFSHNPNLTEIHCLDNQLTSADFLSTLPSPEKVVGLSIGANPFSQQDLNFLRPFANLKILTLSDTKFTGSLTPLQDLNNLLLIRIDNTSLASDLERLPINLRTIYVWGVPDLQKKLVGFEWPGKRDTNFEWFVSPESDYCYNYQAWRKYYMVDEVIRIKEREKGSFLENISTKGDLKKKVRANLTSSTLANWKEHPYSFEKFTEELTQEWINCGFNKKETEEWLESGLQSTDANFAQWLRDVRVISTEWFSSYNNKQQLRWEYSLTLKLSRESISQIKIFRYHHSPFAFYDEQLTQKELEEKKKEETLLKLLVPNNELRERYKWYGLCRECQQPKTDLNWCRPCSTRHFQAEFDDWTSGNEVIDKFIKKYQLETETTTGIIRVLEWIPHDRFVDIEYLAEGGFGKVYRAKWIDGEIKRWSAGNKKWGRQVYGGGYYPVALKSLNNSQNISTDFLQEINNHKSVNDAFVVRCFGISQDPETKNYVMVMEYKSGGSLREYLQNNYDKLNFWIKLSCLHTIVSGLKDIHSQELVHHDFHPGNILNKDLEFHITDLGLCRPANETDKGKVYGVLPYVAPEVLNGKPYTQAADVYSFGMVAYELFSGLPPYHNMPHSTDLTLKICLGLRPNLNNVRVPQLLKDLISRCWDADPLRRPTSYELFGILYDWNLVIDDNEQWRFRFGNKEHKKDSEFAQQFKEIETEELNDLKTWLQEDKTREKGLNWGEFLKERNLSKICYADDNYNYCAFGYQEYARIYKQWKSEVSKKTNLPLAYKTNSHSQVIYTSRLLDIEKLPKPQNSQEINNQFWNSANDSLFILKTNDFTEFNVQEEISIKIEKEQIEQEAKIQLPSKK